MKDMMMMMMMMMIIIIIIIPRDIVCFRNITALHKGDDDDDDNNNNNHHHHHHHCRRKKLLATDLNFVHSNRGTKMKPVRQALVLTYRTKPVPEMKYAYCRAGQTSLHYTLHAFRTKVICKQLTHDHKSVCWILS